MIYSRWVTFGIMDDITSTRHLLGVPDTDDVKQKNKNHETILSRLFPEQKTKRSFDPL